MFGSVLACNRVQPPAFPSLGILAHLLRMVSWNLNTFRFGGDGNHPNHHLTFGLLSHFGPFFIKSFCSLYVVFDLKKHNIIPQKSFKKNPVVGHQPWRSFLRFASVNFFGDYPPKKRNGALQPWMKTWIQVLVEVVGSSRGETPKKPRQQKLP